MFHLIAVRDFISEKFPQVPPQVLHSGTEHACLSRAREICATAALVSNDMSVARSKPWTYWIIPAAV